MVTAPIKLQQLKDKIIVRFWLPFIHHDSQGFGEITSVRKLGDIHLCNDEYLGETLSHK